MKNRLPLPRRCLVTDAGDLLEPAVELLRRAGVEVDVLAEGTPVGTAVTRAADCPVVIVGVMSIGRAAVQRLHSTALLIRAGIGYDVIDVDAATKAGIWVANVPDYCVDEVADHSLLLLLAAARRLPTLASLWRDHRRWAVADLLPAVHRLRGRRLGVVGLGRIGAAVALRAAAFGWEVVAHDPLIPADRLPDVGARQVSVDELFATSHAITLHCPLTPETRHLVNRERLASMRSGVVIVNTSRGGLIDLDALDEALAAGRVAAVGLDVVEGEPDPDLRHPLLGREQAIVTPHIAWYSLEARHELATKTGEEALRYLNGERPRNIVNPAARQS